VRLEGLEVVVAVVEFDEEAVGEDGHGGDYVEDDFSDGFVDDGEVGDVGCVCEVEFDGWGVDECDLCGADLCTGQ
jgi:hypothetical protein